MTFNKICHFPVFSLSRINKTNFLSNLNSNSPHFIKSNQNVHKLKLSKEEIPTTSQMLYNTNLLFSFAQEQSLFLEKPEETSNPLQLETSEIIQQTSLLALQAQFQALAKAFSKTEYPEERILLIHAFSEASKNYQQFSELNVKVNLLHSMSTDQSAHNLEFHFSSDRLLQFFSALSTNFDSFRAIYISRREYFKRKQ